MRDGDCEMDGMRDRVYPYENILSYSMVNSMVF